MMRRISQELDHLSAALVERVITDGVEAGEFACADPAAAATRLTSIVDGLAVQFAAHSGAMSRDQFIEHVRTLAAWEVGLTTAAFRDPGDALLAAPTVLTPATDSALRTLVSRWCDAATRLDPTECAECCTPDAVWQHGKHPVASRDAIEEALQQQFKRLTWMVQYAPNSVFEVDEGSGTATGRVITQETMRPKKGAVETTLGVYHDRYVRLDGVWRFSERRDQSLHSA